MKQLYALALLALLFSCKEKESTNKNAGLANGKDTLSAKGIATTDHQSLASIIRPGEQLVLEQIYNDNVEFINFDGNGDYALFTIQKNKKLVSFYTDLAAARSYKRGDLLQVEWKMDTIYEAGEGEKQDFAEWLVKATKVKDGNVSLFLKKHPKPVKYYAEEDLTTDFKDYLYEQVEYYLANSTNELVKDAVKNPNLDLSYSIEEKEREGRSYYVLGISNDFEHHTNIMQWLYLDNEHRKLYEYDLPNDRLVPFD